MHPQYMLVMSKNMKIVKKNLLKIVISTAVKNRCILHGHVFVMHRLETLKTLKKCNILT